MSKRVSGPPRRPRNPVARQVRSPLYRMRVEKDRKRDPAMPDQRLIHEQLEAEAEGNTRQDGEDGETENPNGEAVGR